MRDWRLHRLTRLLKPNRSSSREVMMACIHVLLLCLDQEARLVYILGKLRCKRRARRTYHGHHAGCVSETFVREPGPCCGILYIGTAAASIRRIPVTALGRSRTLSKRGVSMPQGCLLHDTPAEIRHDLLLKSNWKRDRNPTSCGSFPEPAGVRGPRKVCCRSERADRIGKNRCPNNMNGGMT